MDQQNETSKDFAGKNGFTWWIGYVEDRQDPLKLGRVRVRCVGWHNEAKTALPTENLPWGMVLYPPNNQNPYAPKEGDMVFGFFLDGENAQQPVVLGVFPSIPLRGANPKDGFNDPRTSSELNAAPIKRDEPEIGHPRILDEPTTPRVSRNEKIEETAVGYKKGRKARIVEPDPYYNAKYPYNNTYESESGHLLEFDDTRGQERIHLFHRCGSYMEWNTQGDRSERIDRNKYTVVMNDEEVYVKGDVRVYVDGNVDIVVRGHYNVFAGGEIHLKSDTHIQLTAPRIDFN